MKRILALILVFLSNLTSFAHEHYVIDNLISDSTSIYPVKIAKGDTSVITANGKKIANGETVDFVKVLNGYALVKHQGRLMAVGQNCLMFCPDPSNPDSHSFQNEDVQRYHSKIGHFFYTHTPYYILLILIILTAIIIPLNQYIVRARWLAFLLLHSASFLLFAITIMEIAAHYYTGDILWWIDQDRMGFWKTCLLCLPLTLGLVLQLYIGYDYKRLVQLASKEDKLSWKPMFIGFALAIPIGIVVGIAMAMFNLRPYTNIAVTISVLGTLGFCFMKILGRNCKAVGTGLGITFSLFSFFFAFSTILVGCLAIQILLKLLLTALLAAFPWIILVMAMTSKPEPPHVKTWEEKQAEEREKEREASRYKLAYELPLGSPERARANIHEGRPPWM